MGGKCRSMQQRLQTRAGSHAAFRGLGVQRAEQAPSTLSRAYPPGGRQPMNYWCDVSAGDSRAMSSEVY